MKKPNQLPYIAFEGVGKTKEEVLDSLIAIEPLLVMVGYRKPYEDWNNEFCKNDSNHKVSWNKSTIIVGGDMDAVRYHNHFSRTTIRFKATEIKQFINYMIKEGYLK